MTTLNGLLLVALALGAMYFNDRRDERGRGDANSPDVAELVNVITRALADSMATSAKSVGEAVSVSMVPPATADDTPARVREVAERAAEQIIDAHDASTDYTDGDAWLGVDRPVVAVGGGFGIPGLAKEVDIAVAGQDASDAFLAGNLNEKFDEFMAGPA